MSKHEADSSAFNQERRRTLKILGASFLGLAALSTGCRNEANPGQTGHAPATSTARPAPAAPAVPTTSVAAPPAASHADTSKMSYRVNPRNGDKISLLGFGCMRFPTLPSPDGKGKVIDEETAYKLVDCAWAHGVNYYDTAFFYHDGASESMIGKALARYPRQSFFLADKMPTRVIESLEQAKIIFGDQLKKCQVDYFDYYLLHNLDNLSDCKRVYEEYGVLDFLIEQKKQGRIRQLGWSFHGNQELFLYALDKLGYNWDFVQIQLNYNDWGDTEPENTDRPSAHWMYEELKKRHIPIVVMEPLWGGKLAQLNPMAVATFKSANPQVSAASWAFRYVADLPEVLTALSGMTYMEHLEDNIKTFSPIQPLTAADRRVIAKARAAFRSDNTIPCTNCLYCMPCPYGVNIPALFLHQNKCTKEELLPKDSGDPEYQRLRREYLISYDRAANPLQQAGRCIGCGQCVPKCPQKLDIPTLLTQIHEQYETLMTKKKKGGPSEDKKGRDHSSRGRR